MLLQIASRAETGLSQLRPIWRATFWALTELPARVEALLPRPSVKPMSAMKPTPEQPDNNHQCDWAPRDTAYTLGAAGVPQIMTSSAEGACGLLDWPAAS